MPDAIIDIPEGVQNFQDQHPVFEVIIKRDGKVFYHNKVYALVMNMVQSITDLDIKTLELGGDSQVFGAGHPIIQFFAFDQLRVKLKPVLDMATRGLYEITKHPELKKHLKGIAEVNSIKK